MRLSLAGLMAIGAAAPAFADRPITLSVKEAQGYARITAKWADGDETAPKVTATVAGNDQVLILRFDQKVTLDLEALQKALPSWAAATRMDPDGMTARLGLKQPSRLHLSTSIDLAAVDLVPKDAKTDPPDIVSPLAAKRAKEAEAKRLAAIPPPPKIEDLEVRGSHAGDSSRLAFYWPERVGYRVVQQGEGVLKLLFARRAKADIAYLRITPPPNLADFQAENTDKGYLVTITSKDKLPIKHFVDGDVPVIDITRPPAPPPPEEAKAEPAAAPPDKKREPVPIAEKPIHLAPPKAPVKDDEQSAADAAAKAAAEQTALADATLGGPERVTELVSSWTDPAPPNGLVDVKVAALSNGLELEIEFAMPAPAAVFTRGSAVWAVFAANADLRLDQAALPTGFRIRTMRGTNATLMRIEGPKGLTVSAESEASVWTIRLAPTAMRPKRFLKPERRLIDGAHARIETMLIGAAGLVWFEDPVIGDKVAAAVSYGPSSASPTPRDFVEAAIPASAHGLAIAPKSDEVVVTVQRERVSVTTLPGAQTAAAPVAAESAPRAPVKDPGFIDFASWGKARGAEYFAERVRLDVVAAQADPSTREGSAAMLDLARFYLGHEMDVEALGILTVAAAERPEIEHDPAFLALRGVANYMAHRLTEAEDDLSRGSLRGEPSASLWRALLAVEQSQWERATELFREAEAKIFTYPPDKAAEFAAAWAEAALHTNDYDLARRQAERALSGRRETRERGELVLASLAAVIDGPGAAFDDFARLSKDASEPVAVRAELKRLEAGVASGRMTANDAAGELESLRYRWRGDNEEMQTVGILADLYMRVCPYREALLLAQSAALRDADAPGARELRIKLSDYFRRLFLDGEADRLDPIQAVALFYEFDDDLMPIGTDGDAMVRKLAQRLVAFDLLEPAGQLLQYQVDNRLRGVSKAAVAVDLAAVYLWDKRPERALAAINTTRLPSLPKELTLERRLMEAAAYRDLGRYDHVIELMAPLDGAEAKSLLAEAYWRGRKYAEAAQSFLGMLPKPGEARAGDADVAFKGAIAARMARDMTLLGEYRRYAGLFEGHANKASFDLITSQTDVAGAALSEAVRRLADAPHVDAFAAAMKQRFETPSPSAASAAAQTAAAAPAPAPPAATGGSR